jgi:uncharacterized protein YneR
MTVIKTKLKAIKRKITKDLFNSPGDLLLGELETFKAELTSHQAHIKRKLDAVLRYLAMAAIDDISHPSMQYEMIRRRFKILSQNEEDGLILTLFKLIGATNRRFVDIGCGGTGGNSGFLAQECGWSGLMVDGDEGNIIKIKARYAGNGVKGLAAFVTKDNVNDLLKDEGYAGEIDLLSIDIDGNDYWIWDAVSVCSPRVVIMEYNWKFGPNSAVTIPYKADFHWRNDAFKGYHGASLAALDKLGIKKGYRLIACDQAGVNAFFLRNDIKPDIPRCEVIHAYRTHNKEDRSDIFKSIKKAGLSLVEV